MRFVKLLIALCLPLLAVAYPAGGTGHGLQVSREALPDANPAPEASPALSPDAAPAPAADVGPDAAQVEARIVHNYDLQSFNGSLTGAVAAARQHSAYGTHTGKMTWYRVENPAENHGWSGHVACWQFGSGWKDTDYIIAVKESLFDWSMCGKTMKITSLTTGKSVSARVLDYCVGSGCQDLDVTRPVFSKVDNLVTGIVPIKWTL